MPPPIPASQLLKAVTISPCRHHHPLIYGKKQHQNPSHMVLRSKSILYPASNPRTFINCSSSTRNNNIFIARRRSSAVSVGGRLMTSAGARKWSDGDRIQSSLRHCSEMNGTFKEQEDQEEKRPKLLTIPTVLTLGRVAAVPLLVSTFHMNGWWATTTTTSIFIAAAVTDWLDGYIARKMRLGSAFGAFLDPVADKLMVAATLVLLCTRPLEVAIFGEVPWLLTVPSIAIIGREITMSAVREWAASQDGKVLQAVAVNNLGKWKTATQMTALTILLATRDSSLSGQGVLVAAGVVLLYISAGLALWSLAVYMRKIWRFLL